MTFPTFQQVSKTPFSALPSRVQTEVFPVFERFLTPETSVLIGVSTGVDSMTLACLLGIRYHHHNFPFANLHILHCNHQIRKQSEIEENYVKTFFAWQDIQIFSRPATIQTTEKALREWRYSCFATRKQGGLLMLGHHLEDRIESTFLNCIRWAGLKGFLNMQILQSHPLLSFPVCRPLLTSTKSQIIAFCEQVGMQYFADETNADLATSQRNLLRHEILEKLIEMNHWKSRFLESMRNIYTEINQIMFPAVKGRGVCQQKIPLIPIATFPARNATYAYTTSSTNILEIRNHLHIATNLRSSQIQERTKRLTETQSGWKEIHDVYFFFHEQQLYIIAPRCKEGTDPAVGYRRASKEFWKNYLPDQQPITKLWPQTIAGITVTVKEERLLGATLRFPQPGDRFAGKTRNRRCINQKIPLFRRNAIPLAVKEGRILHMRKDVMR